MIAEDSVSGTSHRSASSVDFLPLLPLGIEIGLKVMRLKAAVGFV